MIFEALIFISFVQSSLQETLFENDACKDYDGVMGVCKMLGNCNTGLAAIKSIRPPKICSFIDDHPVVCCVSKRDRTTTTDWYIQENIGETNNPDWRQKSVSTEAYTRASTETFFGFQNRQDGKDILSAERKPFSNGRFYTTTTTTDQPFRNRLDDTTVPTWRRKSFENFFPATPVTSTESKAFDDRHGESRKPAWWHEPSVSPNFITAPTTPISSTEEVSQKELEETETHGPYWGIEPEWYASDTTVRIKPQYKVENDDCVCHNGMRGVCKRLDNCSSALAAVKSIVPPTICGYRDHHPIVCCPSKKKNQVVTSNRDFENRARRIERAVETSQEIHSKTAYIARKKCKEFSDSVIVEVDSATLGPDKIETKDRYDLCVGFGDPPPAEIEKAKSREYPHMALIGYKESKIEWLCSGNLISERFVLSLAHCSTTKRKDPALWVKLGDMDHSKDYDDAEPQIIKIVERYVHPDYGPVTLYNDIALFKLERDLIFNPFVRPVCLSTEKSDVSETAIGTGWDFSLTYQNEENSVGAMTKIKLNIMNNAVCNLQYKNVLGRTIPDGIREESMICASDNGEDICQKNYVGSIQEADKEFYCMYGLTGMTSFGKRCSNGSLDVYTRVSHYLPWIVGIVWPNEEAN